MGREGGRGREGGLLLGLILDTYLTPHTLSTNARTLLPTPSQLLERQHLFNPSIIVCSIILATLSELAYCPYPNPLALILPTPTHSTYPSSLFTSPLALTMPSLPCSNYTLTLLLPQQPHSLVPTLPQHLLCRSIGWPTLPHEDWMHLLVSWPTIYIQVRG